MTTDPRVLAMLPKKQRQARKKAQHINAVESMHRAAQR